MPKCEQYEREVDLPFECKFCGGYFCLEHRLPENHNCPNLPPRTPLGRWQAKREIIYPQIQKENEQFERREISIPIINIVRKPICFQSFALIGKQINS
ncbi:MAG: AN1-type zinc finger protein [Candidatus Bathyarchaeia archaeon]